MRIALGSAGKLEYYAILAGDLKFLSRTVLADMIGASAEVKKLITGLLKAVTRIPLMTKSETEN